MDYSQNMDIASVTKHESETHKLSERWVLWAHLPHVIDWSMKSFIEIHGVNNVKETTDLVNYLPNNLINNCMLFYLREGIKPIWEDPKNRDGGCFTFKIFNKDVPGVWKDLMYSVCGESVSNNIEFNESVNGITVSPKRTFCIIKIWMRTKKFSDPSIITPIKNLSFSGCKFKEHTESYNKTTNKFSKYRK